MWRNMHRYCALPTNPKTESPPYPSGRTMASGLTQASNSDSLT